jgi:hypothetical protein
MSLDSNNIKGVTEVRKLLISVAALLCMTVLVATGQTTSGEALEKAQRIAAGYGNKPYSALTKEQQDKFNAVMDVYAKLYDQELKLKEVQMQSAKPPQTPAEAMQRVNAIAAKYGNKPWHLLAPAQEAEIRSALDVWSRLMDAKLQQEAKDRYMQRMELEAIQRTQQAFETDQELKRAQINALNAQRMGQFIQPSPVLIPGSSNDDKHNELIKAIRGCGLMDIPGISC